MVGGLFGMGTDRKIKVLIVDDYELVREGLLSIFETIQDFEVVGSTGDARMALTLCAASNLDVVLMDMVMSNMDGVEATRLIQDQFPQIKVVVLSMSMDSTQIHDVLLAGAISYLSK